MEDILKGYEGEDRSSRSTITGKRRKRKDERKGKTAMTNRGLEGSNRKKRGEREEERAMPGEQR